MFDIKPFYEADSVGDVIAALTADPQSQVISRGTDMLIRVREGENIGRDLVSIRGIPELKGASLEKDGTIIIRPTTPFSHIANDPIIKKHLNMLGEAVSQVGGSQVRGTATTGGNIYSGATSADSASTMCVLNATMVLKGSEGVREVPVTEFYTDPGRTVRKWNEACMTFKVTRENYEGWEGHYTECGKRRAMEVATLGCTVKVKLSPDKTVLEDVHLAYGAATPTPMRCYGAEEVPHGKQVSDATIYDLFADKVLSQVNPRTSWRASWGFRLQFIGELARHALEISITLVEGKVDA